MEGTEARSPVYRFLTTWPRLSASPRNWWSKQVKNSLIGGFTDRRLKWILYLSLEAGRFAALYENIFIIVIIIIYFFFDNLFKLERFRRKWLLIERYPSPSFGMESTVNWQIPRQGKVRVTGCICHDRY